MKALHGGALLCLICCFIQESYTTDPIRPIPAIPMSVTATALGGNKWVVYTRIFNIPSDYTEPLMSAAAVDAVGDGISTCSAVRGAGAGGANAIDLYFVVDIVTHQVFDSEPGITDPLVPGPSCGTTTSGTGIAFKIQTFETTDTTTDGDFSIVYEIDFQASSLGSSQFFTGEYANPPPLDPINLVAPVITSTLKSVDADETTETNSFALGDTFHLRVQVEIDATGLTDGYTDKLDVAGAVVHSCDVATDAAMMTDLTQFVDNTNCIVPTGLFSTSEPNQGFSRQAATNLAGNVKTYYAVSMPLEAGAVIPADTSVMSHMLFFKCSLSYNCYDDSVATAGTCGGNHCPSHVRRKKRSVSRNDTTVTTQVKIFREKPGQKDAKPCAGSLTFNATIGTLGTTAILLFMGVVFSFSNLRRTRTKLQEKSSFDGCRVSGGSRNTSVTTISSDGRSMKC